MDGGEMKYQIIYADPPWPMKLISRKVRPKQLNMPYSTMDIDAIKNMPIHQIIDKEHCHLFLWTTHKFLPKAFDVMDSWGFSYNCLLTWDKTYGFTPFSFMFSSEFMLYGQLKNKWVRPRGIGKFKTVFTEKPRKHSQKPEITKDIITGFCGDLPRIELFARQNTPGWDAWGNECISTPIFKQENI
jgi:N6-adenosine-specific RNA methylase IME4